MTTLKKIAVVLPLIILLAAPILVGAQSSDIDTTPDPSPVEDVQGLNETIDRITGFLQSLLFALAAIFIIIAGYQYVTAAGNEESVGKAKNNLIYALIAIVLGIVATGVANLLSNVLFA